MIRKIFTGVLIVALVLLQAPGVAVAAQMTAVKDTLSTVTINQPATHVITATLVGSNTFAAGDSIVYDFTDGDFTMNGIGNWQPSDFAFSDSTGSRTILAVSVSSGVAPTCTTAGNNVCVTIDISAKTFTVFPTSGGGFTASSAASPTTFTIFGTAGTGNGTMTNKSADVDSSVFTITETTDNATGAVVAETNGTVTVTATVSPTLTFSNDDAAVGFGTLTSGAARWANSGATGSVTDTAAHTMTIGTNATSGYTLTYNGATLTSGSNTITALSSGIVNDADGTPGTSQFGISVAVTGTGSAAGGYDNTSVADWKFVPSAATSLATASVPVTSDSIAVHYLANIPASQPAGIYSTSIEYVATGNF